VVRRLLEAGVAADTRYGNELTALMWAAGHDEGVGARATEAVTGLLLDRGAAIDAADNRGRTALMIAAELGDAAVVELLLKRGADRALRDRQGKTALDLTVNEAVRQKLDTK
jgi:ankyrin repeat protein